ncbi:unnamed protein product [Enterobius vermicularis]|uniref:THAP4-like heme-binding domain-containing protein n=1 Tax=Enterobius vermicularis TaxID=51028 RepID=A0A3P6J848_ENTVE|nr:unnamed protein product [Enterobius vermicularis]
MFLFVSFTFFSCRSIVWDNSDHKELHSENGFIWVSNKTGNFWLNTVMSNGFITAEEGKLCNDTISFVLKKFERLGFSRDLPVRQTLRKWQLLDADHLESKLWMSTFTHHRMMQHAAIVLTKVSS